MICQVSRLRNRGIRVSTKEAKPALGDLRVTEMTQSAFGRAVRVAQLLHPSRPMAAPELLPQLFDVNLIKVENGNLVLTGFERELIDGKLVDFAQTWLARLQV